MYADIGPRSQICNITTVDQSNRVEYAQLNHGAKAKSQKLELTDQRCLGGPGMSGMYSAQAGSLLLFAHYELICCKLTQVI